MWMSPPFSTMTQPLFSRSLRPTQRATAPATAAIGPTPAAAAARYIQAAASWTPGGSASGAREERNSGRSAMWAATTFPHFPDRGERFRGQVAFGPHVEVGGFDRGPEGRAPERFGLPAVDAVEPRVLGVARHPVTCHADHSGSGTRSAGAGSGIWEAPRVKAPDPIHPLRMSAISRARGRLDSGVAGISLPRTVILPLKRSA